MLKVESVIDFAERSEYQGGAEPQAALNARRGGLVHGTRVATKAGWKLVEELRAGDFVRTLDNGFRPVSRVATDCITVPPGETNAENMPIRVPSNAAYNGRPVWLMPEQGVALDSTKLNHDPITLPVSMPIVSARLLSGMFRITSDVPASYFDISTLFFDQDEVIYIEGGFRAFCPAGRFGSGGIYGASPYEVVAGEAAADLIYLTTRNGDIGVLANSLGSVPAPVFDHPIVPVRPVRGARRPGRPGRPVMMI
ncbi:Hint domain-containing protein [Ruegeria arenilitoris]|uniref:Hint domain-containing protein n=1 Tax=Ruegeria arenilitoris TaxID=1173585 RepID=UPI00147E81F2|nr:Hint domain-containing protein [Ruegeria arenilitoris]